MTARTSIVTDWRVRDEDKLPNVPPGEYYERVIAPQKFIVLRQILVRDMTLSRLEIGMVKNIPFELESEDGPQRIYRLKDLDNDDLKKRLIATGAAVAPQNTIAIAPALEVRTILRNDGNIPAKPRTSLLVYEEIR